MGITAIAFFIGLALGYVTTIIGLTILDLGAVDEYAEGYDDGYKDAERIIYDALGR